MTGQRTRQALHFLQTDFGELDQAKMRRAFAVKLDHRATGSEALVRRQQRGRQFGGSSRRPRQQVNTAGQTIDAQDEKQQMDTRGCGLGQPWQLWPGQHGVEHSVESWLGERVARIKTLAAAALANDFGGAHRAGVGVWGKGGSGEERAFNVFIKKMFYKFHLRRQIKFLKI